MIIANPSHQQGAVLIVGLLLLISMTLLTIGGMQSVSMNEHMATNAHTENRRMQAAESAGAFSLNQMSWINQTLTYMANPGFSNWPTYQVDLNDPDMSVEVVLSAESVPMMGFTMNVNSASSYIRLDADSRSTFATGTTQRVVQGFVRVGAG